MSSESYPPAGAVSGRPLSADALTRALVRPGGFWREIGVTGLTGSTNADMLALAAGGAPEGSVLVAEAQAAGRGRMGRTWVTLPGTGLAFSVLLRPTMIAPARLGWIPLLAGLAVASAVRGLAGLDALLKWPNDVLVGDAKLAGILAEQTAGAVVVGVGINVSATRAELPVETATSLFLQGAAHVSRQRLLCGVLGELERLYLAWTAAAAGDQGPPPAGAVTGGLAAEYRRRCATLGRRVRVELPGGAAVRGTALDVDPGGRLLLQTENGPLALSAGDVVHLR